MKTLFRNCYLADGSGKPLRKAAVLTKGNRIVAVEPEITGSSSADRTINLGKKILAPGFIDAHGHSDLSLLAHPEAFGKVSQGITCEIMGNCGLSPFPVSECNREHLDELWAQYHTPISWNDYTGWKSKRKSHFRAEALVGHNTLRAAVAGYEEREVSRAQLEEMKRLLDKELTAGALGLSSGLLYVPGKFAAPDEITELLRVVAKHNKIYATHLRSEGNELLESIRETLEIVRAAGLKRLQISHFKTAGKANWHKLDEAIALIEESGISVTVDRYPYTQSMTQLSVILPGRYGDMDDVTLMRELKDPQAAAEVESLLDASERDWKSVTLIKQGVPLAAEAERRGLSPARLTVELLRADAPGCAAAFAGMSEENMKRILRLPYCMMGSDENARPMDYSIGRSHPRAFGSAARFLRLLLEMNAPIEEAVRRMTGLPADTFQLPYGKIVPGGSADLTAFDPEEVDGAADFAAPHTPARGILLTMAGGEMAYRK